MVRMIRTHLAWKMFLSFVLVILVGAVVLATASSLVVPAAFSRHIAGMTSMMSGGNTAESAQALQQELFSNYTAAVTDALTLSTLAALIAAVLASFFISRQVVTPVQQMMKLSHRIAEGEYAERLAISGEVRENQLDELDQLALSFNQMAEKLEKTEAMRRQLIGDVTHELRTPLAAIKGYVEGLMDGILPAEVDTYQQVYAEIDRLQRLVNDLQELSRVEAGAFQLAPASASISDLIETVRRNLQHQFDQKNIRLEIQTAPDLPHVMVDKDRILQVITNLVGNALNYTPGGGKVTIQAVREKSQIIVSVCDTGIGIAPEHLPLIFNRFYRVDKSRTRASGGSGIGLTIAQALIKAHHGHLWAESAGVGKGSTFKFTLPIPDA